MKYLFVIQLTNRGYGETDYCLVWARTLVEAQHKAHGKYPTGREEAEKRGAGSIPDCAVGFDADGISRPFTHVW